MSTASPFSFTGPEHFFASAFSELHKALTFAGNAIKQVDTPTVQAEVEGISALVPGYGQDAVVIERAAFSALGTILGTVNSADAAATANGLNITLDAATVASFKALIANFEQELSSLGVKV